MEFEGKTVICEGSRVIGLNDVDLEKISKANESVNQAVAAESVAPETTVVTPEVAVTTETPVEASVQTTSVEEPVNETVVSDVVDAVKNEETNIFDNKPVEATVQEAPAEAVVEDTNIFDNPAVDVASNLNSEIVTAPATEQNLETPAQFYKGETTEESIGNEILYLDKIKSALITYKEENSALKNEIADLKNQINKLTSELEVANQRTAIAEGQRAQQVAGMPTQDAVEQPVTPIQTV